MYVAKGIGKFDMEKQTSASDETTSYKEYSPSEIYTTSDPPPAYIKPRQTSIVQVARIAAYTLVAVSFILGSFILASSYVTATLSCQEYQPYPQEYIEDRLPRFQGLVADPLESEETKHVHIESADQHKEHEPEQPAKDQLAEQSTIKDEQQVDQSKEDKEIDEEEQEFKFKLPIHLDLDALTGALLDGNSKSKMNCVVEKQKSEEVLNKDHRDLITFGLDLAALDPGLKHITGERLAIVCETSREAPKESQQNQVILPFPLPGIHSMHPRMMPHALSHQMPHQMPQMMPQNAFPRVPFNLPFLRPNPMQNFMRRPQSQSFPRRNIEEIPILVLEDETRLQNLIELPRPAQPQIQNLQNVVELHRANPQIQNIIDLALARSAAPALHNIVELPENKPFHMMHPPAPEARNLPPWARPEVQEQVVQIQAIPTMMRPPQPPRPVQVESRSFPVQAAAIHVEGRPIQVEERPIQVEGRPVQVEGRPVHIEPRPIQMEPHPMQMEHHSPQMEHRPIQMEPRPMQMEHRPVRMEPHSEGRHPEGRSLSVEGRAFPVPSETINPPPLPFDMPEPARPHWGQWLGGCLSDKSCSTQINQISGERASPQR